MPKSFIHRNERSGSRIVGNTYAPVTDRVADVLNKHGVQVYDEKWVEWHYNLARDMPRTYFRVEVDGFMLSTAADVKDFFCR